MNQSAAVVRVDKDMSIGHADFWRGFVKIDSPRVAEAIGNSAGRRELRFGWRNGEVRVQLSEEQVRQIAALSLPRTQVTLEFSELSESDISEFLAEFERRFQRAGG